jgi:hypothetical protein
MTILFKGVEYKSLADVPDSMVAVIPACEVKHKVSRRVCLSGMVPNHTPPDIDGPSASWGMNVELNSNRT